MTDLHKQSLKFLSVWPVNSIWRFYFLLSLEDCFPGSEWLRLLSSPAPAPGRYPLADCVEREREGESGGQTNNALCLMHPARQPPRSHCRVAWGLEIFFANTGSFFWKSWLQRAAVSLFLEFWGPQWLLCDPKVGSKWLLGKNPS